MSRVSEITGTKIIKNKKNKFMRRLLLVVIAAMLCLNLVAQSDLQAKIDSVKAELARLESCIKEKTEKRVYEQDSGKIFIVDHYKESYSTVFMCIVKTERDSGGQMNVLESYFACKDGSYAEGYEDGYNKKKHRELVGLLKKAVKLTGAIAYGTDAPSVSVETISYNVGYVDGEKDRMKEEKEREKLEKKK